MIRILKNLFPIILLLQACECDCPTDSNVFLDYAAGVVVSRIIDGDTFEFQERSEAIQIRVLHLDCYETRRSDKLREQASKAGITEDSALSLGFLAKGFADSLLLKRSILIERDTTQANFDSFGRLLRIVIVDGLNYAEQVKGRGFGF